MVSQVVDRVIASGRVPEPLLRASIRASCGSRLRRERRLDRKESFIASLTLEPIAREVEKANEQHYEVASEFFRLALGPRLKYSSCIWTNGINTLAEAEDAMLTLTCERAEIEDGMKILDLGCGWGSLSLWLAERYPNSQIIAVSNSKPQRAFIDSFGAPNLRVLTADANQLELPASDFDRILSIEMLEHMRNYDLLLQRISSWLRPDGKFFCHVFSHRDLAYPYDRGWMTRRFFTAGTMPSHDLLPRLGRTLRLEHEWRVSGAHYAQTAEAWLDRMTENRQAITDIVGDVAYNEWRVFFLACAELWGYRNGSEWQVSHYLFRRAADESSSQREPECSHTASEIGAHACAASTLWEPKRAAASPRRRRRYDRLVRYRKEIVVTRDQGDVFAYLADFSRASEWDPGIAEARRLTAGPTAVGSRFEVIAIFRGKPQRFEYVVTEYSEGNRIALRGDGPKALSEDTITVESRDGRTHITYEANLRLKGVYRAAEPFLGGTIARMGDDALAGLKAQLDDVA